MILFIIILAGLGFLGLVIKVAEGALRIFLILIVLILIILGSVFSGGNQPGPSAQLEIQQLKDA